ncbi:MAG: F0F1 ATP synthase subunit epsilon [Bacteroidales bacterium]|nr:F0F1 ATP synthase subunit epsilon [Bacteroidales bacterium]MBQ9311728.1 F0F1 ATP synthase subunit epsilon [Bacteroidales bacterium]
MKVDIITPEETLYSGQAKDVRLIGLDGHFQILNNHAPIVSALAKGEIKIIDGEDILHSFQINGGIVEMSDNAIHILAQ